MLRLRPYNKNDAKTIISWIQDEKAFYKWTAGILGEFPIDEETFQQVNNLMAFTAIDDNEIVGFFTLRDPGQTFEELRFGFVVVDPNIRGKGYGKKMIMLGLTYAKEIYGVKKVSLGVFENNEPAYYCYKSAGFVEDISAEKEVYPILDENWNCLVMEYKFDTAE
ncbi:MAG: GNAT family N-acetyltransferase [Eubacteriales bacterium]|nr:GNAT family N-acetyltransferase [Lachnospiraceae bacterium]MDO5127576.1 GNAT family N-acetyltransferase [Eubacteriales bacterium]